MGKSLRHKRLPCVEAVLAVLAAAGIVPEPPRATGSQHVQIRWIANGHKRVVHVASTASDVRAAANVRAVVRRLLRADGIVVKR